MSIGEEDDSSLSSLPVASSEPHCCCRCRGRLPMASADEGPAMNGVASRKGKEESGDDEGPGGWGKSEVRWCAGEERWAWGMGK